jgi:hypothetical protein
MKVKINRKQEKSTNMSKLNNVLIHKQWAKEEITKEF